MQRYDQYFDYEAQIKALEYIRDMPTSLRALFEDDKKCKKVLNLLIDKVIVYSKENPKIVLPGRKKAIQRIPYAIVIRFRLPESVLENEFAFDTMDYEQAVDIYGLAEP